MGTRIITAKESPEEVLPKGHFSWESSEEEEEEEQCHVRQRGGTVGGGHGQEGGRRCMALTGPRLRLMNI